MTSLSFIQWIHECVCSCMKGDDDENENEVEKEDRDKERKSDEYFIELDLFINEL